MSVLSWLRDRMYQDLPDEMQRKMLANIRHWEPWRREYRKLLSDHRRKMAIINQRGREMLFGG